jgi:4-carboxymuconolactone decarboxylase
MSDQEKLGRELHRATHGDSGVQRMKHLEEFAPDFVSQVFAFGYCEGYEQKHFDLKTRTLLTVAMLAAMGNAPIQLETHLRAAIRAGYSKDELLSLMKQVAVYAGFPAATNGVLALRRVLELDIKT